MKLAFRRRVALFSATASGVVLVGFVVSAGLLNFDNMLEEADHVLLEGAGRIVFALDPETDTLADGTQPVVFLGGSPAELHLIELAAPDGRIIHDDISWPTKSRPAVFPVERGIIRTRKAQGRLWRIIGVEITGHRIALAVDIEELRKESWKMAGTFLRALPAGLLVVALAAWWAAGLAVKPLRAMTGIAETISPDGRGQRMPVDDRDDEIGRLGTVLNGMIDRIEGAFRQATRFSADASHELRTPLTVMQGKLDAALQNADSPEDQRIFAELLEQVHRLKSLTDSLLLFSRSDIDRFHLAREPIDLGALLVELVEDIRAETEAAAIHVIADIEPEISIDADPRLLRLAIYNLLQNAAKYVAPPPGGTNGTIRCRLRNDGAAVISIANTGPPVPPEEREKIFDRFYQGDNRSSGSGGFGIGLSLARVIIRGHGGTLALEEQRSEAMTTFTVRLPGMGGSADAA